MLPEEVLATASIFRGASPDDLSGLGPQTRTARFAKGEYVWHVGDRAGEMLVVLSGELQISRVGIDGGEFVVETYLPGDVLGQLPFFDEQPAQLMDARAVQASEVLLVPRLALVRHLQRHPSLALRMLAAYSRWIRQRDLALSDTVFQNLSGKVACKLLELADLYGEETAEGTAIARDLPQHELAAMIGGTRENVNRALKRLLRDGDVVRHGRRFVVVDRVLLRKRYGWSAPPEWARAVVYSPTANGIRSQRTRRRARAGLDRAGAEGTR